MARHSDKLANSGNTQPGAGRIMAAGWVLGARLGGRTTVAGVVMADLGSDVADVALPAGMAAAGMAVVARATAGAGRLPGCGREPDGAQ